MAKKVKRALVTGGAGFIGSHLCDALLDDGCEVVCLDNFATGRAANIEGERANPLFSLIEADVTEHLDVEADMIFHLASPASPLDYYAMPVETLMANSLGTMNCLDAAARLGVRMLMASTSEVYGDPDVSPQG